MRIVFDFIPVKQLLAVSSLFILVISCDKKAGRLQPEVESGTAGARNNVNGKGFGNLSPEMVLTWNNAASYVVLRTMQLQPTPRIAPFRESYYYAMINIAVHDALNNIVPRFKTFALDFRDKDANKDAAVAQAAHDVIAFFFNKLNPPLNSIPQTIKDSVDQLLVKSLNLIPAGEAKTKGIGLGAAAAQAIIQSRVGDGFSTTQYSIVQGTMSGQYRSTPPFEASGFYDSPGWGDVRPFALQSSTQFPVPGPYPLNSPEYTVDYNEIKNMGCLNCTGEGGRTPDQERIAKFWVESSALGWNKVAKAIIAQKNMDAWKTARLFAMLQMSVADAYIACLKAKTSFMFWRPYTAIRMGDADGNPNTAGETTWQVLVPPIPPIADHPSAHAAAGGAASELLMQFFGKDEFDFSFESSSLPGLPRSFASFSMAARENSLSRIYVGYHFRKAVTDGEALGKSIGGWIATHILPEK